MVREVTPQIVKLSKNKWDYLVVKKSVFREYDIRGVYGSDITDEFAKLLGIAYGRKLKDELGTKPSYAVGVGRDCRISGPTLVQHLAQGLISEGIDVVDCGMGATPQLYFSVFHKNLDGGIQVTASHNPGDQNGFKIMIGKETLSGSSIADLYERMLLLENKVSKQEESDTIGQLRSYDAASEYGTYLVENSLSHMGSRRLKVVVDGGNGVGGPVGVPVLRNLGCEVIELYTNPDGTFPNHHPDPTVLENIVDLRRVVVEQKADIGIGWDGDADRIGVVDEKGNPIYGDMLLLIFGIELLKDIPRPTIIGDVKCSQILFDTLNAKGANAVMAKTGHSLIKAKLKELNAELAGEMSGHMFFAHRYLGFDDALHAAARICEILSNSNVPCSGLLSGIPEVFSTPEIRVDCEDHLKFDIVEKVKEYFADEDIVTIDGVRMKFSEGWGLVRASNTQAALVMRFESSNESKLQAYRDRFEEAIARAQEELA